MKRILSGPLLLLLFGCGEDVLPPPPPPPGPGTPPAIRIVSGNSQRGKVGTMLAHPLVVRVTDPQGFGAAGVPVRWTATADAGEFAVAGENSVPAAVTATGGDGSTSIFFRPTSGITVTPEGGIAWITVIAEVDGLPASRVTFTFDVLPPGVPAEVFIPFGPVFDCTGGNDPSRFDDPDGTIPVGSLVVWQYAPWLSSLCAARVKSTSVPEGAKPIDSGLIGPGQLFGTLLSVAGDYVIADVNYGGTLILKVR